MCVQLTQCTLRSGTELYISIFYIFLWTHITLPPMNLFIIFSILNPISVNNTSVSANHSVERYWASTVIPLYFTNLNVEGLPPEYSCHPHSCFQSPPNNIIPLPDLWFYWCNYLIILQCNLIICYKHNLKMFLFYFFLFKNCNYCFCVQWRCV